MELSFFLYGLNLERKILDTFVFVKLIVVISRDNYS
jgi:hypothetical protein